MSTPQLGMKRLVYAPKAYVFVHSTTQNKIYNLTPDVVSGEVVRNINAESTASVVLRNRYRKWLKDPDNQKSILLPDDMITIWLQRISGKPIQVFTGYLDTVPYYQMYPGNCEIKATCTLKRLANTYFDPGTMFFTNWISNLKGWVIDPNTGEASNPLQSANSQNPNDTNQSINDGGFAQLINNFMVQIANWRPQWVLVDGIDPNIPKIAGALYQRINKQDEQALRGLQQIMASVLGVHITPASGQGLADGPSIVPNQILGTINTMKKKASAKNIPLLALVTAGQLTTNMVVGYHVSYESQTSADAWGYGIFALKPKVTSTSAVRVPDPSSGQSTIVHRGHEASTIDGFSKKQISQLPISCDVVINRLIKVDQQGAPNKNGNYSGAVKNGNTKPLKEWIEKALGNRTFTEDEFSAALAKARTYVGAWGTDHPGGLTKEPLMTKTVRSTSHLTWQSQEVKNYRTQGDDMQIYKDAYAGHALDSVAPYYYMARHSYKTLRLSKAVLPGAAAKPNEMYISGNETELQNYFDTLGKHTKKDSNGKLALSDVTYFHGGGADTYLNGVKHTVSNSHANFRPTVRVAVPTNPNTLAYPTFDGQKIITKTVPLGIAPTGGGNPATGASGDNTIRAEDVVAMSMASAFATTLEFPTNYIEAMLLTGYKAFENDITCLEGVQQFCQASLRNFMSLPDGRFIAFYPDYFGAHGRQAYWPIYDIEITNGGVQLSDDSLATHVYATGDVGSVDNSIDFMDRVASRGVVTLDMPLLLRSFIQPGITEQDANIHDLGWAPGNLRTAFDFYNHFGVRVYKEDVPIIRNTFYEFLYAWQRFMMKWAETFQTTFEFTFQPEILAGGIVAFPQHNLQMFVKSVTHTWDYSSGFQTDAELMAPAALHKVKPGKRISEQDVGDLPGFAIGGNVNSVGAVTD